MMAVPRSLAGLGRTAPWQSLLNLPQLRERFLGNCQRLHQNGYIPQFAWDDIQIMFIFHHELGHVTVALFDTPLCKIARITKILAALTASEAFRMTTRS